MNDSSRHIYLLVILTMALLMLLSAMPWSRLTGNVIKDFDLFEDLFPIERTIMNVELPTDPELQALSQGGEAGQSGAPQGSPAAADSSLVDSVPAPPPVVADEAPMADGVVLIENYTGTSRPFDRFREALASASSRRVRIAVIGDSYIEGDIFCQNLRDLLQQRYGGQGVGFMAMHSDFPGFRRSVRQSGSGWAMHDIRSLSRRDSLRTLSGDYAKADAMSQAVFKASDAFEGTRSWSHSSLLFIAPDSGTVTLTGADGVPQSFEVASSPAVQQLVLPGNTTSFAVESGIPGLVALGAYLDGDAGVQLDCMSVRGNSGLALRMLNRALCEQMRRYVDYDLIILEFGMNAISPDQTNYDTYADAMTNSVERVRRCYPDADILVMGVGDRGSRGGNAVHSLPAAVGMVKAQRRMARDARTLFWDTRAAMGGDDAIADWRKRRLVNADYVHLNHAGGAELAALLDKAIMKALDE